LVFFFQRMFIYWSYSKPNPPDPEVARRTLEPLLNWTISYHLARPLVDLYRSNGVYGIQELTSREFTYFATLMQACYLTVVKWKEDPVRAANLDWIRFIRPGAGQTDGEPSPRSAEFQVACRRWDCRAETKVEAEQRLRAAYDAAVGRMLDEEKQQAQHFGGLPVPRRYERKHFDWLVLYQVAQQGASAIGRAEKESRQTVEKGIERAAEILVGHAYKRWLRRIH
jgi:hypothetical protein